MLLIFEAFVEETGDFGLVEVLADKHEFLHAVAVGFIPVATQGCILLHHALKLVFGHGSVEITSIFECFLLTSLFEEAAHVGVVGEIANAFCTNDVFRPFACHKLIEFAQIESRSAIVNEGADTVFFSFALIMGMMVMMMVVAMMFVFFIIVVIVMVVMVMLMFVIIIIVVMIVMVVMFFFVVVIIVAFLNLLNPSGRSSHFFKVEKASVQNFVEINVAIVASDDFGFRL